MELRCRNGQITESMQNRQNNGLTLTLLNLFIRRYFTMKFIYPAVFRKNEEGRYKAFFPDLACCEAEGDTLDDAIDNANEAAYNWIYAEVMEDEMDLPAISDESDLDLLEGDIVRNIQVNIRMYDGWDE